MEGEGEGPFARWSMEGEGEGPFALTPTSPQANLLKPSLFIL
jgi:hypothetical protein